MGSDLSPWEFDVLIHGFQMGMVADNFVLIFFGRVWGIR